MLLQFDDTDEIKFEQTTDFDTTGEKYMIKEISEYLIPYMDRDRISDDDRAKLKDVLNTFLTNARHHYHHKFIVDNNMDLEDLVKKVIDISSNTSIDLNWLETSQVVSMADVFNEVNFTGDISEWNTSNVKTMARMFRHSNFNGNIDNWDTSKVEDMSFLFQNNKSFNRDLSNWKTGKVKTMNCMAAGATMFDKDSIQNWDYHRCRDRYLIYGKEKVQN